MIAGLLGGRFEGSEGAVKVGVRLEPHEYSPPDPVRADLGTHGVRTLGEAPSLEGFSDL